MVGKSLLFFILTFIALILYSRFAQRVGALLAGREEKLHDCSEFRRGFAHSSQLLVLVILI